MIDELTRNINTEIEMLREISSYSRRLESASEEERNLLEGAIKYLREGIKTVNNSIPLLARDITLAKKLPFREGATKVKKEKKLERVKIRGVSRHFDVVIGVKDKDKFLKELSISEKYIRKLKKGKAADEETYDEFKASRGYLKAANKMFLKTAGIWIRRGRFKLLSTEVRKANLAILFEGYIAMMFFTVMLSVILGFVLMITFFFVNVSFSWPFFSIVDGDYLARFVKVIWIPFVVPAIVFLSIYYYPSTEKKSIERRIDQELPFAVIHMSAVSGSGIEPSSIFKIIGLNKEYPYLRKEIRKILNQINLYGYDLVTALNNAAKSSPSEKLAELFSGISSTITSGASLSEFFEKRSESLLLSYRLERENYTKLVETFMDIYISLVIAAPMIFLLLLIMMTLSGISVGLTGPQLSVLSVAVIALLNVFFLVFLQLRQPTY